MVALFFCDVCKRPVPPAADGLCGRADCVNAVVQQEREENPEEEPPYILGQDIGGEG